MTRKAGLSAILPSEAIGRPGDSRISFDSTDPVNGFHYLSEAYRATDPDFDRTGHRARAVGSGNRKIVNNSEDDICRMFNDAFRPLAASRDADFFPKEIEAEHKRIEPIHLREHQQRSLPGWVCHPAAAV